MAPEHERCPTSRDRRSAVPSGARGAAATPAVPSIADRDIRRYREEGYLVSDLVLPEQRIAEAERAIAAIRAGRFDRDLGGRAAIFDRATTTTERVEQYGYLALRVDAFRSLLDDGTVAAAAAALAGTGSIRLFHDRLMIKHPETADRPDGSVVGWHTDKAYWATATSDAMLTAWIPFQDCDAAMGALSVVPGSHRWRGTDGLTTAHETDLGAREAQLQAAGLQVDRRTYRMVRGQVAFHNCRVLHGSGRNLTGSERVSWSVHLQDGANRHRPAWRDDGRPIGHLNELLCRYDEAGNPDFTDPEIFPRLWPAS